MGVGELDLVALVQADPALDAAAFRADLDRRLDNRHFDDRRDDDLA